MDLKIYLVAITNVIITFSSQLALRIFIIFLSKLWMSRKFFHNAVHSLEMLAFMIFQHIFILVLSSDFGLGEEKMREKKIIILHTIFDII